MKITRVKASLIRCETSEPIKFAHMEIPTRSMILVEIFTDEGITGIGEIDAWPTGDVSAINMINSKFQELLKHKNPLNIQEIWSNLFNTILLPMGRTKGLEVYCLGAIDMALWDILGKQLNQPVSRLLGRSREKIQAYASLSYLQADKVGSKVEDIIDKGFKAFKIRLGVDPNNDVEIVRIARKTAGSTIKIMVDINSGWLPQESIKRARSLEQFDITWIEEPLSSNDIDNTARLARNTSIPIALGEHQIFNRYDVKDVLLKEAASIIQPDIRAGGISECKKIADVASCWNVPCVPHFFGNCVRLSAMSNLLMAIQNAWLLEYDISDNPLRTQLPKEPIVPKDGHIYASDKPGLGIELDNELIKKWSIN